MNSYTECVEWNGGKFYFKVDRLDLAPNGVVIFMPSAKSEAYKNLRPYFPRGKWSNSLENLCVIYIADPYDEPPYSENFNGSWFISPDLGISALPFVSMHIKKILKNHHGKVLVYGSSMGGFSALYLGAMLSSDGIYAECPQIDLRDYPGSREIAKRLVEMNNAGEEWLNVFSFFRKNRFPCGEVKISLNIGDRPHMRYLYKELNNEENKELLMGIAEGKFSISLSCHSSGFGHVNFTHDEVIEDILSFYES
ncbi:hypothetical protein [Halomonas sp. BL6]|uniref:hypothetical protein n=1 Tax=Halomonas sp. BL6 TaxID=2585770 RepID=UPI0011191E87|nr:hypothetical protein [Halomonas sp. BL6]TNH16622.1 hypothetical protein FHJ80_10040 [Halomonas sp. BL6]